jgi:hypothetical protein
MHGLYTQRNNIRWTPEVKLGEATHLIEEWNGLKGPNPDVATDD